MAESRVLVKNAADPEQVAAGARTKRQRQTLYQMALREVLRHEPGRLVLGEILEHAGIYEETFHPNHGQMSLNEGRRRLGLQIRQSILEADEAAFELLEREHRARLASES